MKILARWTTFLMLMSAPNWLAGDETPPRIRQTESPEFADNELGESEGGSLDSTPPAEDPEDLPLEVPLSPPDPFLPRAADKGVPVPSPWIEQAPPVAEMQFAPEPLPSEYLEYQGTVINYFPQHCPEYCAPPWDAGHAGGYWTEAGECQCRSKRLRWWQKACPWNWGRDFEHEPRCQHCIKASLRAMARMHPPGMLQSATMGIQVSNANAAQMMLHHYDFVGDTAELTIRGERELRRMASVLPWSPYRITIEATPYRSSLALARQAAVLQRLNAMFPGGEFSERVIISEPYTRGLDGIDAISVQSGLLQLQSGGFGGPAGGVEGPAGGVGGPTGGGAGFGGFGGP